MSVVEFSPSGNVADLQEETPHQRHNVRSYYRTKNRTPSREQDVRSHYETKARGSASLRKLFIPQRNKEIHTLVPMSTTFYYLRDRIPIWDSEGQLFTYRDMKIEKVEGSRIQDYNSNFILSLDGDVFLNGIKVPLGSKFKSMRVLTCRFVLPVNGLPKDWIPNFYFEGHSYDPEIQKSTSISYMYLFLEHQDLETSIAIFQFPQHLIGAKIILHNFDRNLDVSSAQLLVDDSRSIALVCDRQGALFYVQIIHPSKGDSKVLIQEHRLSFKVDHIFRNLDESVYFLEKKTGVVVMLGPLRLKSDNQSLVNYMAQFPREFLLIGNSEHSLHYINTLFDVVKIDTKGKLTYIIQKGNTLLVIDFSKPGIMFSLGGIVDFLFPNKFHMFGSDTNRCLILDETGFIHELIETVTGDGNVEFDYARISKHGGFSFHYPG